jgi:hypothetical protein
MGSSRPKPPGAVCLRGRCGVVRGDDASFRRGQIIPIRAWALPLLILSSLAAVPRPAAATVEVPQDIVRQVVFGQRSWTVRWQARARHHGGFYRLYAGQSHDSLRLVDVQRTVRGIGDYHYIDGPDGSPQLYYQLRYADPSGEELVLATLRLDIDGVGSLPASVGQDETGFKAMFEVRCPLLLASRRRAQQREAGPRKAESTQPEVPPPKPGE